MLRTSILLIFILSLAACSSLLNSTSDTQVVHIVLVWLKEPQNEQHVQKIIEATQQLKEIKELKQLRVGESISSDRKIVDDSFDIGIYMIFDDTKAMNRYLIHPKHKETVKNIIKPLSKKIRVHDFDSL